MDCTVSMLFRGIQKSSVQFQILADSQFNCREKEEGEKLNGRAVNGTQDPTHSGQALYP